jgi:hypothetical protein
MIAGFVFLKAKCGPTEPTIDQAKMETFLSRAVNDFGAAVSAALVVITRPVRYRGRLLFGRSSDQ